MVSEQNYILLDLGLKLLARNQGINSVPDFIVWEYSFYSNYVLAFKGFPQLQIAMISDIGVIKAFPIDGQPYETFPEFQPRKFDDFKMDNYLSL